MQGAFSVTRGKTAVSQLECSFCPLVRVQGIGVKAIEELKAGLEARELLYILEDEEDAEEPDASQLLEMLFSPEDAMYMGGDVPQSYSADPDDVENELIGGPAQRRASSDDEMLEELLGGLSESGFGVTDEASEAAANEEENNDLLG